jgi:ABC-type branched-subunit amino acid transport system substrate-binding protein
MRIQTGIRNFTLFIGCLLTLSACETLPTGRNQIPAPVEQYGVNSNSLRNFENTGPTKVAILLPLSGKNAELGQTMLQAAQLAVFDINNNDFELIPHDTKGTFEGGQAAAESAINNDAQIILGPLFSDAVRGAKKIATPNDVKIIAFSTDWSLGDTATFMMGFMPFSQVERIVDYAVSKSLRRFAIIAPRDKYGEAVTESFKKHSAENNSSVVTTISYIPSNMAIANKISSINPNDIDAVFIPTGGKDLEVISDALTSQGMPPSKIKRLGTGLWDDTNIAAKAGVQGGWFAAPSSRSRQSFERQYQSTYGQSPIRMATLAYDATALAAVLSPKGYSFKVLTDPNGFEGVDGVFRFGADGIIQRDLAVFEIRNGQIREIQPASKKF